MADPIYKYQKYRDRYRRALQVGASYNPFSYIIPEFLSQYLRTETVVPRPTKLFYFGSAKPRHTMLTKSPITQQNIQGYFYGQDAIAYITPGNMSAGEYLFTVCDGHGSGGEEWSSIVSMALTNRIYESIDEIKEALSVDETDRVKTVIQDIFRNRVEAELLANDRILARSSGGTTATVTLIVILDERRFIIQAAVGDSPGYLASRSVSGKIRTLQLVTEANCDNKQSVEDYVDRHLLNGVDIEDIPPIIYSRFNCPGNSSKLKGVTHVLPAWNWSIGRTGNLKVTPNLDSFAKIEENGFYWGQQSMNWPPLVYREAEGDWRLKNPTRDAANNFGNSVHCGGQNLTGFGDMSGGLKCDCDASVTVLEYNEAGWIFAYSDGVGDVLPPEKWAELFSQVRDSTEVNIEWAKKKIEFNWMEERGAGQPPYEWRGDNPTWDDISAIGIHLEEM